MTLDGRWLGVGRRLTTVIMFVLCAVALLAGCGDDETDSGETTAEETADAAQLESEIDSDLTESAGVAPDAVECPSDIPLVEGEAFECTVTAPNGDEVVFEGTLTDEEGSFEGEVVAPDQSGEQGNESGTPDVAALESSLLTTIEDVRDSPETPLESVECPDDALGEDPATFDCELVGGGETGEVEVTVRGSEFEYSGAFGGSAFGGSPQEIEPAP